MTWLVRLLPWLKGLFNKIGTDSRADELRAEAELVEARAFATKGRIAPRYLWQYVLTIVFAGFFVWLMAWAAFPAAVVSPLSCMDDFFKAAAKAVALVFVGGGQ